jgi:molybdate transport system ATP-binding protein
MNAIDATFRTKQGNFTLDVAFSCPAQGVTGLFGPSGCGKTTVLRCLAGLTRAQEGRLIVNGEVWQDKARFLPPYRRAVGYVFQDAQLFGHLTVADNLAYGLKRARGQAAAISLNSTVELMGIGALLSRMPRALSGGERQRVAIARALLSQPRLLLMDEPLSALDRAAKHEILPYLEMLPKAFAIPIVYVSHEMAEIERLADHLVLMRKEGRVEAQGRVEGLLTDLALPLARQPDAVSILPVVVDSVDGEYGLSECTLGGLAFTVPGDLGPRGTVRRVRVAANDVSLQTAAPSGTSILNVLPAAIVSAKVVSHSQVLVLLELAGSDGPLRLLSSITRRSWDRLGLKLGDPVFAQVKGMALLDRASSSHLATRPSSATTISPCLDSTCATGSK